MSSVFDRLALAGLGGTVIVPFILAATHDIPTTAAKDCARSPDVLPAEALITLQRDGIVVLPVPLPTTLITQARSRARDLVAHMSQDLGTSQEVRRDFTTWIRLSDNQTGDVSLESCAALLRGLAFELDKSPAFTRSHTHRSPLDLQLACFDGGGAFYRAHRDAPTLGTSSSLLYLGLQGWLAARPYRRRCITAILYLNDQDWCCDPDTDGGALRVYLGAETDDEVGTTAAQVLSICPSSGTLVLFDSQQILHEVCPSNRQRIALTCWIAGEYTGQEPPKSGPTTPRP